MTQRTAKEIALVVGCSNRSARQLAITKGWSRVKIKGKNEYLFEVSDEELATVKPTRGRPTKSKWNIPTW